MATIEPTAEYDKHLPRWQLIDDIASGDIMEYKVWESQGLYLPELWSNGDIEKQRRIDFVSGAALLNAVGRTIEGSAGAVFRKLPAIKLTPNMAYLEDNATGSGETLQQLGQSGVAENVGKGYGCYLTDYPEVTESQSAASDGKNGRVAVISQYDAKQIIRVKTSTVGMEQFIEQVVLEEKYLEETSEFNNELKTRYRVLQYDENGNYIQRVIEEESGDMTGMITMPTDYNGMPLKKIPISLFGAQSNDAHIDDAPMYPMSKINQSHLISSALRNESLRQLGPTVFLEPSERMDSEQFAKDHPGGVTMGSNQAYIGFSNAFLLQAEANDALSADMEAKKIDMISAGAMIIEPSVSNVSTETVIVQRSTDFTILSMSANNVEAALNEQLMFCSMFMNGGEDNSITFNRDYFDRSLTAQERTAWASDVMMGNVTKEEYRTKLEQTGEIAKVDNDELPEDSGLGGEGDGGTDGEVSA